MKKRLSKIVYSLPFYQEKKEAQIRSDERARMLAAVLYEVDDWYTIAPKYRTRERLEEKIEAIK